MTERDQTTGCNPRKTEKMGKFLHALDGDPEKTQTICCEPEHNAGIIAADSHPGFSRHVNEDAFGTYLSQNNGSRFLVVADGIGGHGNGDLASRLLVQLLLTFWREYQQKLPTDPEQVAKDLEQAVIRINQKIYQVNLSSGNKLPMGSTLALLTVLPEHVITLHLGDSRIYRVRNHEIQQLTEDHSYISQFIRQGTLAPEKAKDHPLAHVILRSVGPTEECEPDVKVHERVAGDRFVVCSDGLTEHLLASDILAEVEKAADPDSAVKALLRATLRDGARDNVTILCTYE